VRRKIILLLVCVMMLLQLTACYDMHEITDLAFVQMVGVDMGVSDKWRLTLKFTPMREEKAGRDTERERGGATKASTGAQTVTVDAPSFYGGISLLNTNIPQRINFSHTVLLVISEELARSGLIGEYIAPLIRFREMRRTIDVAVVSGTAQAFIESTEELLGKSPARAVEDLKFESENTGFFPRINLNDFYNAIKSTYHQPVVMLGGVYNPSNFKQEGEKYRDKLNVAGRYHAGEVPRKGGSLIEFLGSALFDGDKMVGKLDGHETRMMLLAKGDFKRGVFTIQDPKRPELAVPIDLRLARKPQVRVSFKDGIPFITLKLKTEGDIVAIESRINYEDPKMTPILEKAVEQHLKTSLDDVIKKCQFLNCDVFGFGQSAVRHFLTIEEWEAYNWKGHFKEATVNTEIEFKVRRTGGLLKSSEVVSSKGKE